MADSDRPRDLADKAFRELLEHPDNVRDIVSRFLTADELSRFDFDRMKRLQNRATMPAWNSRESDILAEVPYRDGDTTREALICVQIEHQTDVDRWIPLRMLVYATQYWETIYRRWEQSTPPRAELLLPVVIPVVLYVAPKEWSVARTFRELLGPPDRLRGVGPVWEPLFWETPGLTPSELVASQNVFERLMALVQGEKAEYAELEPVVRDLVQSLEPVADTAYSRWQSLMRFATGWVSHRRPKAERGRWRKVVEDGVKNLERRTEVAKMGQTISDAIYQEGKESARHEVLQDLFLKKWEEKYGSVPESVTKRVRSIKNERHLYILLDRVYLSTAADFSLDIDPPT